MTLKYQMCLWSMKIILKLKMSTVKYWYWYEKSKLSMIK